MDIEEAIIINHIFEDVVEAENLAQNPGRTIYPRHDVFRLSDVQFIKLFRLTKDLTRELIEIISPHVPQPMSRSALSVQTMVLIALNFFGHGCYQEAVGRNLFLSVRQGTVSKCIKLISDILNQPDIMNRFIKFPNDMEALRTLRESFFQKFNMPGVVGCIDCTHVAMVAPRVDEHVYVNRKNFHSINVQLVCDHNLKILHVNARYPGSCHDAFIWQQSNLYQTMEQIHRRNENQLFYLIGDSGYPLRPWLLKPLEDIPQPGTAAERFNNQLKTTRSTIERCNGVLKHRFRCLIKQRMLHYEPQRVSKIINACVVLHNMCINNNIALPQEDIEVEVMPDINIQFNEDNEMGRVNPDLLRGRAIRNEIINNYF